MSLYVQKLDLYRDILSIFTHLMVHQTANSIFNSRDLCNEFVVKIKATPTLSHPRGLVIIIIVHLKSPA